MSGPSFISERGKEICVVCYKETDVDFATDVSMRQHFNESGQHCGKCCEEKDLCKSLVG